MGEDVPSASNTLHPSGRAGIHLLLCEFDDEIASYTPANQDNKTNLGQNVVVHDLTNAGNCRKQTHRYDEDDPPKAADQLSY